MFRVATSSRLHFGLLSLAQIPARWPNHLGEAVHAARRFGGVGLMVDRPGVAVYVESSHRWSADGPLAERALAFARRFADAMYLSAVPPCRIIVESSSAPEHVGLGTGTQLGLALARALAANAGLKLSLEELAFAVGRGKRSALGIHGFDKGGFLVEAGQAKPGSIAPLIVRASFPANWRIVLARPGGPLGLHGSSEEDAIGDCLDAIAVEKLSRLVLLGMLPALAEDDCTAFGEALFEFNARAGEAFSSVQGGTYGSAGVANLVTWLRSERIRGVGQSSWGPTAFAIVEDEDRAANLAERIQQRFSNDGEVLISRAANHGAVVTSEISRAPLN